ncbi:MAG: type II toxin-antitoxin system RelE/ParE family toxin [Bdellovibrionota bacterium]
MRVAGTLKDLHLLTRSREELMRFPESVRRDIGYALFRAQQGHKPKNAKPLKGFGGASVQEIIEDFDGDTYRAVYTVKFANAIYVLHCFQKKSKKGKSTPKQSIELIRQRLKIATLDYQEQYKR